MTDLPHTRQSLLVRLKDPADAAAWRTFVDVYGPAVFAFARRNGLQPADAADLTQDVCRSVATAMRSFDYDPDRGRFRGWLFSVVRNQLKMLHRARARHARTTSGAELLAEVPDDATAAETWDLECRRRLFAWACDRVRPTVSAATWTAFWRTAVDDASGEAVAGETGLSSAAVYLAKSRVLAKLRRIVADVEEE
jgi:RNA polymerase sigma factor (sigma-70 family)